MTLSYKNKLYIQIGSLIALMGASTWASLFLFGLITQAGATLSDAQKELASLSVRQEQIASLAKEYEGAHALFASLEERLLPREERLHFIMLVEQLAKEAGVLHEISTADDALAGTAREISPIFFNITVSGEFPAALRFIYLLEHSQYHVGVEKAHISQGGGLTGPRKEGLVSSADNVRVQLSVKVYTRSL